MAGPNRSSVRRQLRSALANKAAADSWLDALVATQAKWNATVTKINSDTPGAFDTNYVVTGALASVYDGDTDRTGDPHKAKMRAVMRSALANRAAADEMIDALEELNVAYGALLAKMDAETGALNDTNYVSTLALTPIAASQDFAGDAYKVSLRKVLRKSLHNAALADQLLDAIIAMQAAFNAVLVKLDAQTITGVVAVHAVTAINPDARS